MLNEKIDTNTTEEPETDIEKSSVGEMPKTKKKKVKVEPYKRRAPGGTRKTVTVKGYTRSSRRKKYSVKSAQKRKKKPKKNLWDIIFGD